MLPYSECSQRRRRRRRRMRKRKRKEKKKVPQGLQETTRISSSISRIFPGNCQQIGGIFLEFRKNPKQFLISHPPPIHPPAYSPLFLIKRRKKKEWMKFNLPAPTFPSFPSLELFKSFDRCRLTPPLYPLPSFHTPHNVAKESRKNLGRISEEDEGAIKHPDWIYRVDVARHSISGDSASYFLCRLFSHGC